MKPAASVLTIADASQISVARRAAAELADSLGFDERTVGEVSLVVTEAGTNLVKFGGGGQIVLRRVEHAGGTLIEILALDRGRGMANVARCLEDGYSTAGSPGTGLGAMQRMSRVLDIYSRDGGGTAIMARVGALAPEVMPRRLESAGLSVAMPGEEQCGDAWDEEPRPNGTSVLVVDGLGHGALAAEAAREAVKTFRRLRGAEPLKRLDAIHRALASTRGATVAVADIDLNEQIVRYAGLGNVSSAIYSNGVARHLVSHNGTAGHTARRLEEYRYPWPECATLVMHSDGVVTNADLARYPGLSERHPSLIAAVLYRDFVRGRDDATVVVVREGAR